MSGSSDRLARALPTGFNGLTPADLQEIIRRAQAELGNRSVSGDDFQVEQVVEEDRVEDSVSGRSTPRMINTQDISLRAEATGENTSPRMLQNRSQDNPQHSDELGNDTPRVPPEEALVPEQPSTTYPNFAENRSINVDPMVAETVEWIVSEVVAQEGSLPRMPPNSQSASSLSSRFQPFHVRPQHRRLSLDASVLSGASSGWSLERNGHATRGDERVERRFMQARRRTVAPRRVFSETPGSSDRRLSSGNVPIRHNTSARPSDALFTPLAHLQFTGPPSINHSPALTPPGWSPGYAAGMVPNRPYHQRARELLPRPLPSPLTPIVIEDDHRTVSMELDDEEDGLAAPAPVSPGRRRRSRESSRSRSPLDRGGNRRRVLPEDPARSPVHVRPLLHRHESPGSADTVASTGEMMPVFEMENEVPAGEQVVVLDGDEFDDQGNGNERNEMQFEPEYDMVYDDAPMDELADPDFNEENDVEENGNRGQLADDMNIGRVADPIAANHLDADDAEEVAQEELETDSGDEEEAHTAISYATSTRSESVSSTQSSASTATVHLLELADRSYSTTSLRTIPCKSPKPHQKTTLFRHHFAGSLTRRGIVTVNQIWSSSMRRKYPNGENMQLTGQFKKLVNPGALEQHQAKRIKLNSAVVPEPLSLSELTSKSQVDLRNILPKNDSREALISCCCRLLGKLGINLRPNQLIIMTKTISATGRLNVSIEVDEGIFNKLFFNPGTVEKAHNYYQSIAKTRDIPSVAHGCRETIELLERFRAQLDPSVFVVHGQHLHEQGPNNNYKDYTLKEAKRTFPNEYNAMVNKLSKPEKRSFKTIIEALRH